MGLCQACLLKIAWRPDAPHANHPEPSSKSTVSPAITEKPGGRIGNYKLLEQVGEGGCGVVYVAEQERPVRRRVALKVIKLGMDTRQVIARFEVERQALALMDHPNIAKVLDAGVTDTGRPYFVMELVKGIPITEYCDENKLDASKRLNLFVQVCQAIQHAHQKGIIHRDIKPWNILVADHDGVPVPKIIDFGIAKATTDQPLTDKTVYTAIEQFIGTPAYMSPEQAKLSGLDIDTRSDIYSLGVLLYELLTGKTPFDAKRLIDAGLDEIRRIIREEDPPRPSTKLSTLEAAEQTAVANRRHSELPKLLGLIRGDLDWIVMKCLEKDRNRRYETANGLAMDVRRFLNNEPILARPPSAANRVSKWIKRNKLAFSAAAGIAASLVIAIVGLAFLVIREKQATLIQSKLRKDAEGAREHEAQQRLIADTARTEAVAAEASTKLNLSASDFREAVRLISEDNANEALAYLARSLSNNPTNRAAVTRLTTLLEYHAWMMPITALQESNEISLAEFSPDGRFVATTVGGTASAWDARKGSRVVGPLQHTAWIHSIQFSPNGRSILTGSDDNTAQLWDLESGKPALPAMKHAGRVTSARFSGDGHWIVTASGDNTARIWNAHTAEPAGEPLKHLAPVRSAQFSPNAERVLTASDDKTACIWDVKTGQLAVGPLNHDSPVLSAEFSADGRRIVTASKDNAWVWDAQSGQRLIGPVNHGGIESAQFSPEDDKIFTVSWDGVARLWDAQTGQKLIDEPRSTAPGLARISPDGMRILSGGWDHLRLSDAHTGQALAEPLKIAPRLIQAKFSPDGRYVFTSSGPGTALIWDTQPRSILVEPLRHNGPVSTIQFSSDGERVVTASSDRTAIVWDAASGQQIAAFLGHSNQVKHAEFSPDGTRVVTASLDGTARIWDAYSGHLEAGPLQHADQVLSAHFSSDGQRVVTASKDRTARLWDARSGQPLANCAHEGSVQTAEFDPNGKRIVTASEDATVRIWDAHTGHALVGPLKHDFGWSFIWAHFSPDGKWVAAADYASTIRIWDSQTGQKLRDLRHPQWPEAAHFSPDSRRIVTTSGPAWVWDVATGQLLGRPLRHDQLVRWAMFTPDGTSILTASPDKTARLWDADAGLVLADPFPHSGPVSQASIGSAGRRMATASEDGSARIWDLTPDTQTYPSWLPELAEAISGQLLTREGRLEPTTIRRTEIINATRNRLEEAREPNFWDTWGLWFLADPLARTISPFSKQTTKMYIEKRITEGTPASLLEAERLAFDNEHLLRRIVMSRLTDLAKPADNSRTRRGPLEAESFYRKILAARLKYEGRQQWDTVKAMENLVLALTQQTNKWSQAEGIQSDIVESKRTLLGNAQADLAPSLLFLAGILQREGKMQQSEVVYRECLSLCQKANTNDLVPVEPALYPLASLLQTQGRDSDVQQLFTEILTPEREQEIGAADLLLWRGDYHARHRRWKDACEDLARAFERNPTNDWNWCAIGPLLIQTGDLKGYERHREALLGRAVPTNSPSWAARAAEISMLMPASSNGLGSASNLAHLVIAAYNPSLSSSSFSFSDRLRALIARTSSCRVQDEVGPSLRVPPVATSKGAPPAIGNSFAERLARLKQFAGAGAEPGIFCEFPPGLVALRKGEFQEAQQWMLGVLAAANEDTLAQAQARLVLALAQHSMGSPDDARTNLSKGTALLKEFDSKIERDDLGSAWEDYLIAQILLREAVSAIGSPGEPGTAAK
jgi:WD40 repeat protein/serine/threonine protein kinase/tetratricopeptide (TPR) repeat protein